MAHSIEFIDLIKDNVTNEMIALDSVILLSCFPVCGDHPIIVLLCTDIDAEN